MSNGHEPKRGVTEYENAPLTGSGYAERPTLKQKIFNHYRRFWWAHLAVFIALGLLITLLLIFVAFPKIAQDDLNKSSLTLTSQISTNPAPNSQDLVLISNAHNPSAFHPKLDAFVAGLYLPDAGKDKPFVHLNIPETHAQKDTTIVVNQTVQIADMEQFIEYSKRTLASETYDIGFYGRTGLHEGSFPVAHVNYQKTLSIKGLNGLKGFKITTFNVSLQPAFDGSNIRGTVFIPNPSVLTITLGDVLLDLAVNKTPIGNSTLQNVVLKPGDNYVNMTGISDQTVVLGLLTTKYKNGILPVTITGNSSTYNGQQLPYFNAALQANVMNTELDVGKALLAIGINITALANGGGGLGGGSSSSSSSGGGLFGATSSSSSGGGLFGAPTSSSSSGGGLFGAPTSSSSSGGGLFGAPSSSSSLGGGLFPAATSSTSSGGFKARAAIPAATMM